MSREPPKLVSTDGNLREPSGNPKKSLPKPRRPLEKTGQNLWDQIIAEYKVEDAEGLETLTLACETLDRAEACHAQLKRDGMVIQTRQGYREHPVLRHELQNRVASSRLLTKLGLSAEPTRPVGRPVVGGLGIKHSPFLGEDDNDA